MEKKMGPEMGMNMMNKMMDGEGESPMQKCMSMCKDMSGALKQTGEVAAFATPELRSMFVEWLDKKEQEVLEVIGQAGPNDLDNIAKSLELTLESTAYLLARMAVSEKLVITVRCPDTSQQEPGADK